jgi:class 3 adenylate cyclase
MDFLNSLDSAERRAFISVAHERTFVRGARLMHEGELADYVIVILGGWTKITVHENGEERVIAERGPGQLVGERGALRVNVRSATVVALGAVRALIMKTEDFASFIDAHPRVLDIVEGQIYDRLTEDQAGDERDDLPASFPLEPSRRGPIEGPRQRLLAGENCTILLTDVVGFGALSRSDEDRRIIRLGSQDMMRSSLGRVWTECLSEDRGDGLLLVVPPHIPTARVMTLLHRELPGKLQRHNRTYSELARIRLRVAINVGPVMSDAVGISGEAIIRAARLIDAPVIKEAMTATGATLGIIASEFVYETAIRHAEWIDVNDYNLVKVNVKESRIPGWMRLIDLSPPEPRLRAPLRSPAWPR